MTYFDAVAILMDLASFPAGETPKVYSCPSCENKITEGWHWCPWCGRPIHWNKIEEEENE